MRLPVEDVTTEQIRKAAELVARRPASSDTRLPADVAEARDLLNDVMVLNLGRDEVSVKVHQVADEVGTYTLAIEGIDPFNARKVGEVLAAKADELLALASRDGTDESQG